MWMARGGDRFDAAPLDSGLGFWHAGRRVTAHGPVGTSGSVSQLCPSTSLASRRFAISRVQTPAELGRAEKPNGATAAAGADSDGPSTRDSDAPPDQASTASTSTRLLAGPIVPSDRDQCPPTADQLQSAVSLGRRGLPRHRCSRRDPAAVRPAALCPSTGRRVSMPASVPRRNMLAADIVHVRDPKQQTTTPAVTVQVVRSRQRSSPSLWLRRRGDDADGPELRDAPVEYRRSELAILSLW